MRKVLGVVLLGSLLLMGMAFSSRTRDQGEKLDKGAKVRCPFTSMLGETDQSQVCPVTGMKSREAFFSPPRMVDGLLVTHSSRPGTEALGKGKARVGAEAKSKMNSGQDCSGAKSRASSSSICPMMSANKTDSSSPCPMMGKKVGASSPCPMMGKKVEASSPCPMASGKSVQEGCQGKSESSSSGKKNLLKDSNRTMKPRILHLKQAILPRDSQDILALR